ncbi:hypothetical protein FRC04_010751 [Tulasnella sp. 424]|nr:hypothetical protein FRC04_010751 [Tulasnella sp. 424]KAG8969277.1 hypothetical protein FRC05_001136 [Tulasnella sp. 425]
MFPFSSIRRIRQQKKDKSIKSVSPSTLSRPRTPSWHCKSPDADSEFEGWHVLPVVDLDKFGQIGLVRTIDGIESSSLYLGSKSTSSLCSPSYDPSISLSLPNKTPEMRSRALSEGLGGTEGRKGGVRSRLGRSRFSRALPPLPAEAPSRSDPAESLHITKPALAGGSSNATRRVAPRKPEWAVWDACSAAPVDVEEGGRGKSQATSALPVESSKPDLPPLPTTIPGPGSQRTRASSVPTLSPSPHYREARSRPPLNTSPLDDSIPSHLERPAPVTDAQSKGSSRDTRPPRPTLEIADAPDISEIARPIHIITRVPSNQPAASTGTVGGAEWSSSDATVLSRFPYPPSSGWAKGVRRCSSAADIRATGTSARDSLPSIYLPTSEGPGLGSPINEEPPKGLPQASTRAPSSESTQNNTRLPPIIIANRPGSKRSGSFVGERDVEKLARGLQELSAIYSTSTSPKSNSDSSGSERGTLGIRHAPGRRRLSSRAVDSIAEESEYEGGTKDAETPSLALPLTSIIRPISPLQINKSPVPSTASESGEEVATPSSLTRKRSASDPSLGSRLRRPFMLGRSRLGPKVDIPPVTPEVQDLPQENSSTTSPPVTVNRSGSAQSSVHPIEGPALVSAEMSQSSSTTGSEERSEETHATAATSESASSGSAAKSVELGEAEPIETPTQPLAFGSSDPALTDDTSSENQAPNSPKPRYQHLSDPVPSFESVPIAWKGLPLEAAEWVYSPARIQQIVSQAIQSSSESSSIRLLPPDVLDRDLPNEVYRLELQRANIKARYNAQIRRRRVLLRSLPLYIEGSDPEAAGRLIKQLGESSEACDTLSEELFQVADQLGQLTEVMLRHEASALSMGIQKLDRNYKQVRGTKIGLQLELTTVEAERDEAWALAEELEQKLKQLYQVGMQEPPTNARFEHSSAWPSAALPLSVSAARQASFRVRARMSRANGSVDARSSFRSGLGPHSGADLRTGRPPSRLQADSVLFGMPDVPQDVVGGTTTRVRALSDPVTSSTRSQTHSPTGSFGSYPPLL